MFLKAAEIGWMMLFMSSCAGLLLSRGGWLLLSKFPEKKFCVQAIVSDQEYGPVVTFSQVRE
jgi:hypothetical protein